MAKKSNNNSSNKSSGKSAISINKVSFWLIVATAVLFLLSMILSAIQFNAVNTVVRALQGVATALITIVVAILAWKYVKNKTIIWKVLYVICLLVIILGIIIPAILL